jgi:hypothetical protein
MEREPSDQTENTESGTDAGTALAIGAGAVAAAAPSLADLFLSGSGAGVAFIAGGLSVLWGRHADQQTENLINAMRERLSQLEANGKLDRDRLGHLEAVGGLQAVWENAWSVAEKTTLYADLLAGLVSIDAPNEIDVEAFLDTIQSLSVQEISLVRAMYDTWEKNENNEQHEGVSPPHWSEDVAFFTKRLEGAGLVISHMRGGPPGAPPRPNGLFEPTPTLTRFVQVLRCGHGE